MDGIRAAEARPGTGAAADGLVIAATFVSKNKIVHRALTRGNDAERLEQQVDETLTRLDVASNDRGCLSRVVRELRVEQATGQGDFDIFH